MRDRRSLRAFGFIAIAVAGGAAAMSGCYSRVVGAKGFGADQYNVSLPYQENSKLDDWVFGARQPDGNSKLKPAPQQ